MTNAKLLIVADDFTGGLDTGVQFARQGVSTRVVTHPEAGWTQTDGQALVVVTESLHLPPRQAGALVARLVGEARQAGIPFVYKKTDSALRGNIGAELGAARAASGAEALPFLPAFPRMRRTTRSGRHFIDGVPVSRSVFGSDPLNPVREDDVAALVAAQTDAPVWNATPDSLAPGRGICVVDAETDDDLLRAGRRLKALGALSVSAGCAGFAAFLPELLELEAGPAPALPELGDGLLVVCGSVNPITRAQLDRAEAHGFRRARLTPEAKLEPGAEAPTLPGKWRILDANDPEPDNAPTRAYAAARGWDMEEVRRRITASLAGMLKSLAAGRDEALLITGGDTLAACLDALNCQSIEPLLELYPGVVLARCVTGARTRLVIAKSGGFGAETLLNDLKDLISAQQGRRA